MKSMRKMQALKPQIDAINAKYKNVGMRDPRKARAEPGGDGRCTRSTASIPMGGCVPMVLQIPFFFAFYKVFTVSVEMRGAQLALGAPTFRSPSTWPSTSCRSS